jgi:AcrR family transcriptional regulator
MSDRRKPQQARAERRKASLLDAAAALLEREGHAAVTTGAIAQEAGASVGTVYQYFPHKEAVLAALMARYRERLGQALQEAVADEEQPLEGLIARGVATYARFHEEEPGYAALWLGGSYLAPLQDDVRGWQQDFATLLGAVLAGRFNVPKRTAERLALTLNQAVSAQIALAMTRTGRERARLLEEAERLALGYLRLSLEELGRSTAQAPARPPRARRRTSADAPRR